MALVTQVEDGLDGRLAVQRVGDGLDQEQIDPALVEPPHLLAIGVIDLVEGHGPRAGVVHVRRHRQHDVQRPDRSGGEARLVRRLRRPAVGGGPGQLRALEVDVVGGAFQAVVALGDPGGAEGVGLADVGARLKVSVMQAGDDVRPGQAEDVVVTLQLAIVIGETVAAKVGLGQPLALDHHAPGAVEDENALLRRLLQRGDTVLPRIWAGHAAASFGETGVSRTPSTRQMA